MSFSPVVVPLNIGGSASSATLDALTKSVARWLNRTDLTEVIPDFVRMAESEFARDSRIRGGFLVTEVNGHTTDGEIVIPADLLELKELTFEGKPYTQLPYEDWRGRTGGAYYSRIGNVLHLVNKPMGNWRLTYAQRLPGLVFAADSNWLLRDHYDVYLWKCCELGSVWMRDAEAAQGYNKKYEMAVSSLVSAINLREWGGEQKQMAAPGVV